MENELVYVIPNWDTDYESHRTRGIKNLQYVPMPVEAVATGFAKLGSPAMATWLGLVWLAMRSPKRGELRHFGGSALSIADISVALLRRKRSISAHLDLFVSIGWMIKSGAEKKRNEEKGTTERAREALAPPVVARPPSSKLKLPMKPFGLARHSLYPPNQIQEAREWLMRFARLLAPVGPPDEEITVRILDAAETEENLGAFLAWVRLTRPDGIKNPYAWFAKVLPSWLLEQPEAANG